MNSTITKQITPTALDGGNEIILANWPNSKHIICSINNDIPDRKPSHLYLLVNRGVLCNCGIEVKNNFLLESLVASHDTNSKLFVYFVVNTAFVNYLDQIDNLTETINVPILNNKTTFEQTLPISLNASNFDTELLIAPKTLKDFIYHYNHKKEIFDLNERHDSMDKNVPTKNFFSSNFIVHVFYVCYCNNFIIGYNFDDIFTMQTQESQNASNKSCFTANKKVK